MEIYKLSPLIKHTSQIECITSYDDYFLLGMRQGHLLMYNLVRTSDDKADVQLMRYNKNFSKKPILQLEVMPEHNALIILTDNIVQVHDLHLVNFPMISSLSRSRGATLFALDTSVCNNETVHRLAIVVKRKLQLYIWKDREEGFLKLDEDINLLEIPKSIAWCQDTIVIGCKGEYYCCQLSDKVPVELFPTSSNRSTEPFVVVTSENTFSLVRENQTVLINSKGEAEKSKLLKWSDVPTALVWDELYCLALVGDTIEVQTIESGGLLQTIPEVPKARFISWAQRGLLYASSISQVWVMQIVDVTLQRKMLLENKQFQLALKITNLSKETEEEKKKIIYDIETLLAFDLFVKKQFTQSMEDFLRLGTNPSEVIRLFPDLLPSNNDVPSTFTQRELEEGLQALIEYLTQVRFQHMLTVQENVKKTGGNLNKQGNTKANLEMLQIIDTTLLKCYLQTNDTLVASLLRSNHCHLAETERTLKKYGKDNELMILYQAKGQHRRALELLQSKGSMDRTISYLQHIGSEHLGIIFEFAEWVLNKSPTEGLKIFTEDLVDVEALPRPNVLDYLLRSHVTLVIPYLEHIIDVWKDTNPIFHNALILKYKEKVLLNDPDSADARKNLRKFLETSEQYIPETILPNFPTDSLLEERAVILGKSGQYKEAIAIFVRALGDVDGAVDYANKIYEKKIPASKNIYIMLIQNILTPKIIPSTLKGITLSPKTAQADLETALRLLEEYASRINALGMLEVLPDNIPVSRIYKFLQVALHENLKERRRMQLMKGLLYAEHLQCQDLRLTLESRNVLITDLIICPVCRKRFGNQSALVLYPNGDIVHYSCQDK